MGMVRTLKKIKFPWGWGLMNYLCGRLTIVVRSYVQLFVVLCRVFSIIVPSYMIYVKHPHKRPNESYYKAYIYMYIYIYIYMYIYIALFRI